MMQKIDTFPVLVKTTVLTLALLAVQSLTETATLHGAERPTIMSGDYSALVVTRFVNKDLVQSWLPKGLVLDKNSPYQDGHPVIIMAGEQRRFARKRYLNLHPDWGRYYRETFVTIPYLKLKSAPEKQPVLHFVRVYVDNRKANDLGNERGWSKRFVRVDCYSNRYCVFGDRSGEGEGGKSSMVFDCRTNFSKQERIVSNCQSMDQIRKMLSMPMVLKKKNGKFKSVAFDWHFRHARIRSVTTDLSIEEGFMPELPAIRETVKGINEADYGAFYIDCHFTAQKMQL